MLFWCFKQRPNHISAWITNIIEITINNNNDMKLMCKFRYQLIQQPLIPPNQDILLRLAPVWPGAFLSQ